MGGSDFDGELTDGNGECGPKIKNMNMEADGR